MMKKETIEDLNKFINAAKTEFNTYADNIQWKQYVKPVNIILESQENGG